MYKKLKPTNPSQRHAIIACRKNIHRGSPLKNLTTSKNLLSRNNMGKRTVVGKISGSKKIYRLVDFKCSFKNSFRFLRLEYDPNRSGYIALIKQGDNISYILSPEGVDIGTNISPNKKIIKIGNTIKLKYIPIGIPLYNIEIKKCKGGQMARSAGNSVTIISKEKNKVFVKMCSGEIRIFSKYCHATIGVVSNVNNKNLMMGNAGRMLWNGIKPRSRGVAKNPVDHPHGGGEGKSGGGRDPVSRTGVLSKGRRTRNNKRYNFIYKYRYKK